MDDDAAYMELVRSNAQSELTALERGLHALGSGLSVRDYANKAGRSKSAVQFERQAAEVLSDVSTSVDSDHARHLAEIHASPKWLWTALVAKLIKDGLTVESVRKVVGFLKDAAPPPEWANAQAIASAAVEGEMKLTEIGRAARPWCCRPSAAGGVNGSGRRRRKLLISPGGSITSWKNQEMRWSRDPEADDEGGLPRGPHRP